MTYEQQLELQNECHAIDGMVTRLMEDGLFHGNNEGTILLLIRRVNAVNLKLLVNAADRP